MANLVRSIRRRFGKTKPVADPRFPKIEGRPYIEVLTALEKSLRADWYLEIGTRSGRSLSHITCNFVSIDPEFAIVAPVFNSARSMLFFQETSDDFFAGGFLGRNAIRPDLAFIDGMHLFEYVLRDFANCERSMGQGGAIALHDVCPTDVPMSSRDMTRLATNLPWTGDVWKFILILRAYRPDLTLDVLDAHKTGLAVVTNLDPANRVLQDNHDRIVAEYMDLDLETFGPGRFYEIAGLSSAGAFVAGLSSA